MDKYKARIVPKNGIMGTYWVTYIRDKEENKNYDISQSYLFSVAHDRYEILKKRVEYLNKEV